MTPKFNLLYYKALLDKCFLRFFDEFNDSFDSVKNQYIFAKDPGKVIMKNIFKTYLIEELKNYVKKFSILQPEYFLIIGACEPTDNFLLQYLDENTFPQKLKNY